MSVVAGGSATAGWYAALEGGPDPVLLPEVQGPALTAERLLLLLHYGIDWSGGWASTRRATYWDRVLPDRVVLATYRSDTLRRWWHEVSTELESAPRNAAERLELAQLLEDADPAGVLSALRHETEALVLRVRIIADAVRAHGRDGVTRVLS